MINNIILIAVSFGVPAIFLVGYFIYKPKNILKISKVVAITLLLLELFRFFYNAFLQDAGAMGAITSNNLTFSFISFMIVLGLFGTFGSNKFSKICSQVFNYCVLIPLILSLFNSSLYIFPSDTHMVISALYFLESGLIISLYVLSLLNMSKTPNKPSIIHVIISMVFALVYMLASVLIHYYWDQVPFNIMFLIAILTGVVSSIIPFFLNLLVYKLIKETNEDI
jgi:hypothetical protein